MFGMSGEHILILAVVLLIFGPRRLPELGNTLGKAMRNFKDSLEGVKDAEFKRLAEETKTEETKSDGLKAETCKAQIAENRNTSLGLTQKSVAESLDSVETAKQS